MTAGVFIALEGGEGAGKSTQCRMLAAALSHRGIEVVTTREPGGTPGAERIRALLLDNEGEGWGFQAEALLFAAARSDHVEQLIRPALAAGKWVVCDRFVDSSRAYQGGGSGLSDDDIQELHRIGSASFLPDLTILIEVSSETAAARLAARDTAGTDRIGGRDPAYHARVARTFARLADREPSRFARIHGDGSPHDVHARIMAALSSFLEHGA